MYQHEDWEVKYCKILYSEHQVYQRPQPSTPAGCGGGVGGVG